MAHDWKAFGDNITTLLKTSGDSGDSGDKLKKQSVDSELAVATSGADVSPLENKWRQPLQASGDSNFVRKQPVSSGVATVATVTRDFTRGKIERDLPAGLPDEWRHGLAEICVMPSPEYFPPQRWQQAVGDGFAFLSRWGLEAARLGWTATDLFGASPSEPWARVGMLGLVPLLDGGAVVALDASAATIETTSGSRLRYRRHVSPDGRVRLWEIGGAK